MSDTDRNADPPIVHCKLALVKVDDAGLLDRWLAEPEIRRLVWRRLDARHVLVDPQSVGSLANLLEEQGIRPRFSRDL